MKTQSVVAVALVALSVGAWATEPTQKISATVWKDGATRAVFDLRVRDGETQKVPLPKGEVLEVSRSSSTGTLVRVLDASGKPITSAALGAGSADKSVRLAFCAQGGAEISSPARQAAPRCKAQ